MTLKYLYSKLIKKLRGAAIINSTIHPTATIYSGTDLVNSAIGKYTYIGYDCHIDKTSIGSFCSLSDHIFIGGAEHPMSWVSTSPMFQNVTGSGTKKRFAKFDANVFRQTTIGHDVWIGHGATIRGGITIGHGAVIGACSVVTADVPPYAIVAGVPAKVLRFRFDETTIQDLLKLEWWNLDETDMQKCAEYIREPKRFIAEVRKIRSSNK